MPDLKISQLTSAATPLAGTEVLPVVQSGSTVKVAVSDLTAGRAVSASALTASSGNLAFTGTAQRIVGDFTNATWANRLAFQTSTVNGGTNVPVLPNGTGTASQIALFGNSDPTNASYAQLVQIGATETRISAAIQGTGTYTPLTFYTGGSERVRVDTSGNVGIGTASPSGNLQVSAANTRVRFSNTAGTATTLLFGADSGSTFLGAETNAPVYFITNNTERMRIDASGNVGIGTTSFGASSQVVLAIANATAVPTGNPTGGGVLYVEAGALKYRGSSGTVTTIANA